MKEIRCNVLRSLGFPNMFKRQSDIEPAYRRTYQWALHDDSLGLRSWLERGNETFWITGKPGSGKSTLMKHLVMNPETMSALQKWAGTREPILASFYFSYLGDDFQKSIRGLLMTILYQIVDKLPGSELRYLPEWSAEESHYHSDHRWTQELLMSCLERLTKSRQDNPQKYCFFIDGLDECESVHTKLLQTLRQVSEYGEIKLCVASREWKVFKDEFLERSTSTYKPIRMEELSLNDIRLFAYGELSMSFGLDACAMRSDGTIESGKDSLSSTHKHCLEIVEEITQKSEGVFVWVYLVVKSVQRGHEEGDDLRMLHARVVQSPPHLYDFYRKLIYERIDSAYRQRTCQALKLACLYADLERSAMESHGSHTSWELSAEYGNFLDFWLILKDPEGVDKENFPSVVQPRTISLEELVKKTQNILSAACRDLLIFTPTIPLVRDRNLKQRRGKVFRVDRTGSTVKFLHKTVFEFLCQDDMRTVINQNVPRMFKAPTFVRSFILARLKVIHPIDIDDMGLLTWIDAGLRSLYIEKLDSFEAENEVARLLNLMEYFFSGSHPWLSAERWQGWLSTQSMGLLVALAPKGSTKTTRIQEMIGPIDFSELPQYTSFFELSIRADTRGPDPGFDKVNISLLRYFSTAGLLQGGPKVAESFYRELFASEEIFFGRLEELRKSYEEDVEALRQDKAFASSWEVAKILLDMRKLADALPEQVSVTHRDEGKRQQRWAEAFSIYGRAHDYFDAGPESSQEHSIPYPARYHDTDRWAWMLRIGRTRQTVYQENVDVMLEEL